MVFADTIFIYIFIVCNICKVIHPFFFLYFSLQTYFEDNPRDLHLLRHDKALHPAVVKPHLKNVPEYLSKYIFSWCMSYMCAVTGRPILDLLKAERLL